MQTVDRNQERKNAAEAAVEQIRDGMIVGLGSGATAGFAIEGIGRRVAGGLSILGIPTSEKSRLLAIEAGIKLTDLNSSPAIDLTIDGADRFDDQLNLIKGGGGALLREKIVAAASARVLIIADAAKRSNPLSGFPVPVEVVPFGTAPLMTRFERMDLHPRLRRTSAGDPFLSDEGHYIIDLHLPVVAQPEELAAELATLPGVVEHGLFLGLADEVLMGDGETVTRFQAE
ncbi:ribose-5-phosphate isomerase RpiA [Planctomicrobium sp. SH664]|uniref:ribose-5-phosphate isomerase RpiA n=1 Tax=Planctomicrobium sp. SH664 TaxID=3448125 RepID=UPI003F5B9573